MKQATSSSSSLAFDDSISNFFLIGTFLISSPGIYVEGRNYVSNRRTKLHAIVNVSIIVASNVAETDTIYIKPLR